ncbi:MAG: hypothetical protein GY703_15225 [Gammaproteobacteria bacterium]|nr:hypothetical protein [Gammaproteobacteria bacterium]
MYFYTSILVLALLLFIPVSKIIWVMSVRRLQKRFDKPLNEEQIKGQQRRAQVIALIVTFLFSWLFNLQLLGSPHG